jgi:Membrane proteins related to metalloendopeptidases
LLISYTPLREFIPGYPNAQDRKNIIENAIKIDSLQNEVEIWKYQLINIQRITKGQEPLNLDSLLNVSKKTDTLKLITNFLKEDSILRAMVLKEEMFNISNRSNKIEQIEGLHFFPPVKGIITEPYNLAIKHPYIDIAAPENSVVSSVLDGTVISAGWNEENGYTIQVQHSNNLISIYKHNSKLLLKTLDKVTAGTPIALVGNTGTLSTGSHLHFELWHNGEPINPQLYINF